VEKKISTKQFPAIEKTKRKIRKAIIGYAFEMSNETKEKFSHKPVS
jgi:hypothetical protein